MATAKKAAGKSKASAAKTAPKKAASAAEVDDILGEAGGDVLEGKAAKGKKAAPAKAAAKKATAPKKARGEGGTTEQVRTALGKLKKLTSYQDIAEATGYDVRLIRRTARAMDEAGEVERKKEGTTVYVKAKK